MMSRVTGAMSFERATLDLQKVSRELQDLQRQMGGYKGNDLKTFGGVASSIVSARSAIAETTARREVSEVAVARLQAQDDALNRTHDVVQRARDSVLKAATLQSGIGLKASLDFIVPELVNALNLEWDGQYVFGGDRGTAPVQPVTADTLQATPDPFQIVGQPPTLQLGDGQSVPLGETADTIARPAFDALRQLRQLMGAGTNLEGPLDSAQVDALLDIAAQLDTARSGVSAATVRNGEAQRAVESAVERFRKREDALQMSLSTQADADLAEVSVALAQKRSQYEAIARVIGELRNLNLLNYLK